MHGCSKGAREEGAVLTISKASGDTIASALPDILAPGLALVFCGINPSAGAETAGRHFASSTNRFWHVVYRAGFTPWQFDPSEATSILRCGFGLTVAIARATSKASDLTRAELHHAKEALAEKIHRYGPSVTAFLGKAAYSAMTSNPRPAWGHQHEPFAGAMAWILPNPSGRNLTFSNKALITAYSDLRRHIEPPAPRTDRFLCKSEPQRQQLKRRTSPIPAQSTTLIAVAPLDSTEEIHLPKRDAVVTENRVCHRDVEVRIRNG